MLVLLFLFAVLGFGVLLVLYGTIAKNRWGINLEPVSCPRCGKPLPALREAQSLRQAMWGGCTCSVCGAGVDKWGREVAPTAPRTIVKPEGQMRRVLKKRFIILTAVGYFCLTLVFDFLGVGPSKGGLPSDLIGWLVVVGAAAVETTTFTVLFYFAWFYLIERFFLKEKGREPR